MKGEMHKANANRQGTAVRSVSSVPSLTASEQGLSHSNSRYGALRAA